MNNCAIVSPDVVLYVHSLIQQNTNANNLTPVYADFYL